jgi:hypothetical protein
VGFLGKFISVIGELQRSLGMPASRLIIPFFIVFRGRAMCMRRKLMLFCGSPVYVVHGFTLLFKHPAQQPAAKKEPANLAPPAPVPKTLSRPMRICANATLQKAGFAIPSNSK